MPKTSRTLVFKHSDDMKDTFNIIKKLSEYKAGINLKTRRGDCIVHTTLSLTTIEKLFGDEFDMKHQTKRIILYKKE